MKKITLSSKARKNIFVYSLIAYPMILFAVFYVGVNAKTLLMAFQTVEGGQTVFAGFTNFKLVFDKLSIDPLFYTSAINSIKMTVICFILSVPLYFLMGYYIYKRRFLSKTLRFIIMLPNIVSNMIIILVFKRVVEDVLPSIFINVENFPNLLTDERYAFATQVFFSVWISFSSNVLVYPNSMNSIPPEIIESAKLDGVNIFQEIWYIILPYVYSTFTTFTVTNVATMFASAGFLVTFFYYDKCPPSAYNMGYYLTVTVMKATNNAQLCFAAAAGMMLTLFSAPMTLILKHVMEKHGPSED